MRNVKKLFGIGAVLAVAGLSGCAPGFVGPVSFRFNSCSPIQQRQSHMTSSFYASKQRVAAVQARFSTAGPARRANAGLVSGECRY